MIRSRALPVFLAVAAFTACSSDKRTGPENPLASQLAAMADSAETEDFRVWSALHTASTMLRAGGQVSTVSIVVDSQPRTFSAVAIRVSYSAAACEQLRNMFNDGLAVVETDGRSDSLTFIPYDPCKPHQFSVAWEGEKMSRIAIIQGDTGTNVLSPDTYDFNFFGEMFDRTTGKDWITVSGTSSNGIVGRGSACRETAREQGITFNCRLVTLTQSFDLVLQELPEFDFDSTMILPVRSPSLGANSPRDTSTVYDSTYVDSGYVWEMGPSHTMVMNRHLINGLAMEITKFDFEDGFGRSMARMNSTRLRRARIR